MGLTRELDAVNDLLDALGQDQISALSSPPVPVDEQKARRALAKKTLELLQEQTWKDNYQEDVSFTADGSGNILLHAPATPSAMDVLRIVLHESNPAFPYGIKRDITYRLNGTNPDTDNWQIYDTLNKTFNMGANATIRTNVWRLVPFNALPEPYRRCIVARAKVQFLTGREASRLKMQEAANDAQEAYRDLLQNHLLVAGTQSSLSPTPQLNLLDNPMIGSWVGNLTPIRPLP